MTKKIKTSFTSTETMLNKLKGQAQEVGMDVSSYISHLVLWKEKIDMQERRNSEMMKELNQTVNAMLKNPSTIETMAQLIQNKGDE